MAKLVGKKERILWRMSLGRELIESTPSLESPACSILRGRLKRWLGFPSYSDGGKV